VAVRATEGAVQPIRVEGEGEERRLPLEGRITVAMARRLGDAALDVVEGAGPETLRLAHTEHLDGAALQVLLTLRDGPTARGRSLRVVSIASSIDETLRAIGLRGALCTEPAPAAGQPS